MSSDDRKFVICTALWVFALVNFFWCFAWSCREERRIALENGYEQVSLPGHDLKAWQKVKGERSR